MMEQLSYYHDLADRILVRLRIGDRSAAGITYVERCLRTINGIKSIERIKRDDLFLIVFDREKIDANSVLRLVGYTGPFLKPASAIVH